MASNLVPLGSLCSFENGDRGSNYPKECDYIDIGIPFISGSALNDGEIVRTELKYISKEKFASLRAGKAHKGDILFSLRGSLGKSVISPFDESAIASALVIIRPNNNIDRDYLYFALNSPYFMRQCINYDNGSIQANLSVEAVKTFDIPLPSFSTQRKIAKILKHINNKIENNNAISAKLESLAKTIYDYWFLQFDFPDDNGRPYKSSGGKMVWNEELKKEIPEGWEVHNISNLCTLGNGINYDKKVNGDKTYKIVNVRDISASSLLINKEAMDEISLPSALANKYLVNKDDILIARSGTPGAVRLVLDIDNVIYCGFIIHCLPNDLEDRLYLTFTLKQYEGTSATKTGGSILQNVSQDTLKSLTIPLPSKNVLSSFNAKLKPLIDKMQLCIEENSQLTSLRDFLLPMLMNGQVTFKEDA